MSQCYFQTEPARLGYCQLEITTVQGPAYLLLKILERKKVCGFQCVEQCHYSSCCVCLLAIYSVGNTTEWLEHIKRI